MLAWALSARRLGAVTVDTLGDHWSMLVGNLVALLVPPAVAVAASLPAPQRFDWSQLRERTEATPPAANRSLSLMFISGLACRCACKSS
jgi:hypothetical protein